MHQRRTTNSGNSLGNHSGLDGSNNGTMYGRSGGGYDIEGGGRRRNDVNSNIMEQQNNERISELSEQVARLKGLTVDIGNEVREQNALLDGLHDRFGNVTDLLSNSLQRIGTMLQTTGGKHMCYMVLFCVFVMVFLYWLMRHSGKHGA
jgi:blocked early in transport 1